MRIFALTLFIFICSASHAQVMDPSLLMFTPSATAATGKGLPVETAMDTGSENSYYVKKKKKPSKKRAPAAEQIPKNDLEKQEEAESTNEEENVIYPGTNLDQKCLITTQSGYFYENHYEFPIAEQGDQNFSQKIRNNFLGGDLEMIDKYRGKLSAQDIRKNIFELSFAPEYVYNNSQSNYYFRNYNYNSPAIEVTTEIWITPFLGIGVDYDTSLLAAVFDSPTTNALSNVTEQTLNFGLKFRRFFSPLPNSSSLAFGLNYTDHQFQVPIGDSVRMSTRNRGAQMFFDFAIPSSRHYLWNFGFNLSPSLSNEESTSGSNFTSGQSGQTLGYGGYIGGEYRFSRAIQTFFKLSTEVYKNQFSGASRGIDPTTSATVTNVNVNDVFYFFTLGVRVGR